MTIKKSNSNMWFILISILLITLIILISFLIYILYYKQNSNIKNNKNDNNFIIIKEEKKDNIPVYPKDLPKYNNNEYQQIGILTSDETDKDPIVLPLFSRKLRNHNDRYNYYTATDKNNMMRLPIKKNNISCEDEIGCNEIYNGDKLNIEIYKDRTFTATIYKIDAPKYFADKY